MTRRPGTPTLSPSRNSDQFHIKIPPLPRLTDAAKLLAEPLYDEPTLTVPASAIQGSDSGLFNLSSNKIAPLRAKLSKCTMVMNNSHVRFDIYVNRIRGVGKISIGDHEFKFTTTRTAIVLISDISPENIYEISMALKDIDFTKSIMLTTERGRTLWLCHIPTEHFPRLVSLASRLRTKQRTEQTPSGLFVDMNAFKAVIKGCETHSTTIPNFDPAQFSAAIKSVMRMNDGRGIPYYFVLAGGAEGMYPYNIYENHQPQTPESCGGLVCMKKGPDTYWLFKQY